MKISISSIAISASSLFLASTILSSCGGTEQKKEEENQEPTTEQHDHHDGMKEGHGEEGHDHDHSAASEGGHENTASFEGEKVEDLSLIIKSYMHLKNSLVADDNQAASEAGKMMLSAFNGFNKSSLPDNKMKEYMEIEESAVENAEHIVNNADVIDHQREHLVVLSKDMSDLIALVGTDQKLYEDFCPMANDGNGAMWISEMAEIQNPYMGSKMPKCGKVQQEIN